MGFLVAVVLVGIVALLVLPKLIARGSFENPKKTASLEFDLRRKPFFVKSELAFYHDLARILEGQPYAIFSKVRLADLFTTHGESRQAVFNKISRKHVDYVIVAMPEGVPIVCIELDGPSHQNEKQ